MPTISVIVPVYKVEPYIHRCIDSILAQTFTDFELILVDDGSPDNCPAICDEYAEIDNRIHVIHQENGGLSAARNSGMAAADGEYITFVDSDDYIAEKMLEEMYIAITDNDCDIAMCASVIVGEGGRESVTGLQNGETVYCGDSLVANMVIPLETAVCGKLFKREITNGSRFPEGRIHGEDLLFLLQIIDGNTKAVTISYAGYYYIKHADSITTGAFNPRSFDEVYCKDTAYKYICEKFPKYEKQALAWCFRARMNLLRSLTVNENKKQYGERIAEYKAWLKKNFAEVKGYISAKTRIEYYIFSISASLYGVFAKRLERSR